MKNLAIVLVGTKYPRNIGLVSRVLENYGIDQLILIAPRCTLDFKAKLGAAQGQAALNNARVYENWDDFYANEPEGPRIALSRRQGRRRGSLSLNSTLQLEGIDTHRPIYLVFGSEDHGLAAEDLQRVHRVAYLEIPGPLQSMNLSHAVLLAVQIYFQKLGSTTETATALEPIQDPENFLRLWLEALNFDLDTHTRWNALTMLKQLIMKATPTNKELNKLEMIVQQTVRKIKSADPSENSPRDPH